MKIVIDPGHGGHDSGAVGPAGARESDLALIMSLLVAGRLSSTESINCLLTRYVDEFIDLAGRCEIANNLDADVFLSIHCNAADSSSAQGFEVWTSPGWTPADPIATALWETFRLRFQDMRARLDTSDGDPDKESKFHVLIGTGMPSVLFELGFISNPAEEQRLLSPLFQLEASDAISSVLRGLNNG